MQVRTKYEKGTFVILPNIDVLVNLSPVAQALYIGICKYSDNNGQCFPSRKILAKNLGYKNASSIDRYVKELASFCLIAIIRRKNDEGENLTNIYQLLLTPEKDENWQSPYSSGQTETT